MMNTSTVPRLKPSALDWLETTAVGTERVKRALLSNIDGHRSVVELESFARAIGLREDALLLLAAQGLIELQVDRVD